MQILVGKDWGSSILWVPSESGGWASCDHRLFDLPQHLLDRCEYITAWHDSWWPGVRAPEPDWGSLEAYKLALAIDLKRHYKDSAQVFVSYGGTVAEVSGSYSQMLQRAP